MSKELREEIENTIAKGMGWIKYDEPYDYEVTPFGGMWVGDEGKTGYDLTKAKFLDEIVDMVERESNKAVIEELERQNKHYLSKGGHLLLYDDENGNPVYLSERLEVLKEQIEYE